MKITPIGIYGPYPAAGGATSCYFVEGEKTRVALDFGSGSLSKLQEYTDPRALDGIILSHLHFDHFCDILPLSYMVSGGFKLYTPASPTDCFSLIKNRKVFDVGVIDGGSRITIGELSFEFQATTHPVESYAVKVTGKDVSFVYTGDTSEVGRLPEFCRGSKFILCDCGGIPGSPHLTLDGGAQLQKASDVPVIVTHINPDHNIAPLAARLGLTVAHAGKSIIL